MPDTLKCYHDWNYKLSEIKNKKQQWYVFIIVIHHVLKIADT